MLVEMDRLSQTIDVEQPWQSPRAVELDSQSVDSWVEGQSWSEQAKEAVRGAVRSLTCSEPAEVSLLWWLWVVHSGANLKMLMAVKDGGQEKKVVEGLAELSARIAALTGNVLLEQPVRSVDSSDPERIRVVTRAGHEFVCSRLVVALPPSLYSTIEWTPPLPPDKAQLGQRMPMGSIIKTVMFYSDRHWAHAGLSGESFDPSPGSPVVYSVDDSGPRGAHPALMGFVSSSAARSLQLLSPEQRRAAVASHYQRVFGFSQPPTGYLEQNWSAEPFSGGCYMGVCAPGVVTGFFAAIRRPAANGRILFCGTETAVRWTGYADGAVESGQRAASALLGLPFDWRRRPAPSLMKNAPIAVTAWEKRLPRLSTIFYGAIAAAAAVVFFKVYLTALE